MGKVYFLLLFFAVFGIFSGERGVNNRLRVRGADEGDYKDARNPLYRLGYFRKYSWQGSGKTILSGIKGLYFCELMAIAQVVSIILCGYYYRERYRFWESRILTGIGAWILVNMLVYYVFRYKYGNILKNEGNDKKYYPFRYKKCAEFFEEEPSVFSCTKENVKAMLSFFRQETYKGELSHSKVIAIDENTSVCFYYKEERETLKIYALICTDRLTKEHLSELDGVFQEFLEQDIVGNMVSEEWYCNLIFVAGRMSECLKEMVAKSMIQLEKRYRLPVAVCLEEEKIYVPNQKDLYGKEEFERMKREIKGILKTREK